MILKMDNLQVFSFIGNPIKKALYEEYQSKIEDSKTQFILFEEEQTEEDLDEEELSEEEDEEDLQSKFETLLLDNQMSSLTVSTQGD